MYNQGVRRLINRDKVKLGELVFDVIVEEEIDDMSEITNKPIEQGGTVSDHVQKQPTYLNLQGAYTGTDAPEQLQKLLKMYYGGKPYKYVGRNAYDNVVIKKLRRRHNRDNRLGFDFEMTLQRVDIAKAETFEVKASPPKVKPKPSNNAPKSKSSKAKTNTQVKKTTTQGRQQPKSKYVAEVRQRSSVAHRVKWGDIKKPGDTVAVMLKAYNFNQIKGKKKKGVGGREETIN